MLKALATRHPNLLALLFGGFLLLLLAILLEGLCWVLLAQRRAEVVQVEKNDWEVEDPQLGYRPRSNFTGREKKWRAHETIYEVTYTFDALHRRGTPQPEGEKQQFALFFGDSFTMGQGVEDSETLPAQFAAREPRYRAYNYGCGGYGPQNMWVHLHRQDFSREVPEGRGILVYTFIEPQLYRAIGAPQLLAIWGKRLPCLQLNTAGRLEFAGLFQDAHPWRCTAASVAAQSQVVQYLGLLAPRLSEADYRFTARILAESRDQAEKLFETVRLVVLFYPAAQEQVLLKQALDRENIEMLDFTHLFETIQASGPLALGDGHPTGAGYGYVAEALSAAIHLPANSAQVQ